MFESFRLAFAKRGRFYLALSMTWLLLGLLMSSTPRGESAGFASGVHPWTYFLNQTIMIAAYLRRAFWPRSLVSSYGWMQPLSLDDVVPHATLIILMLVLTAVILAVKPKLGFLSAWFFVTLSPTSSIVPIPIEVGAERRMYLPLMALVTLLVIGASALFNRLERRFADPTGRLRSWRWQVGRLATLAMIVFTLSANTITRNGEYASALSLDPRSSTAGRPA